ncbi:hypothetical protein Scep_000462 [Stephania cephalantha]|uniref:EF-hand domain-containing protein n=1 Tax=Stephania cephalantha TaxID=152367 RepID=A0AAP0L6R1_9MAGN
MNSQDKEEKLKKIFKLFDLNEDGALNVSEMAALVVLANQTGKFSFQNDDQINQITDQIFHKFGDFIDGAKGLTYEGLLRSYQGRVDDLESDFQALALHLNSSSSSSTTSSASCTKEPTNPFVSESTSPSSSISMVEAKYRIASRTAFPREGIAFEGSWEIVVALENRVNEFLGKLKGEESTVNFYNDHGCLTELEPFFPGKPIVANESDRDYALFTKYLGFLRYAVDGIQRKKSKEQAFDAHLAMGRLLYFHRLFKEALVSFRRSSELERTDALSRLWAGNCLCFLGRYGEAKEEFLWAHEIAEVDRNKWDYLLPKTYINLGIAYEKQGIAAKASENYREAVALCPQNFKYLRLLGSALIQAEDYIAAEKALEEASSLKGNHADAHYDLGRVFHATGRSDRAVQEYRRAMELKPGHVNAMYHLGVLFMEMDRYRMASAMFAQVIDVSPINWRALLNKAVAMSWIAGEDEETTKSMNEAFEIVSNNVESQEMMIAHIKQLQKKPQGGSDERIKDVLAEVCRSYLEFIQGRGGCIISNYFGSAENLNEATVVTTAPPTPTLKNPERVLSKGFQRSRAKQ